MPWSSCTSALPCAGQLEHVHAAVAGMIAAHHELLLLQPVDDVGDGGQGDAEGLGHVAHVTAGMLAHVEEDLRLGVGEVQLRRALPEELAKGRAAEGVQQVEQPLGLRRAAGRGEEPYASNNLPVEHFRPYNDCPGRARPLLRPDPYSRPHSNEMNDLDIAPSIAQDTRPRGVDGIGGVSSLQSRQPSSMMSLGTVLSISRSRMSSKNPCSYTDQSPVLLVAVEHLLSGCESRHVYVVHGHRSRAGNTANRFAWRTRRAATRC